MILYLLRHGIAEDAAAGGDDAARRLTPRGRVRVELAARGMKAIRLECEALLTSPLPRAAETAAIVARVHGGMPAPRVLDALRPGVPAAEIVRALRPAVREKHVMLVGHEPGLSGVAALLLTGSTEGLALALKKGGLVALSLPGSAAPGRAALRWMLTPRQLRGLGR